MKKLFILILLFIASNAYSEPHMMFYFEPHSCLCFMPGYSGSLTYIPCDKVPIKFLRMHSTRGSWGIPRKMTPEEEDKCRKAILQKYGSVTE
jgi:hypothetical protein